MYTYFIKATNLAADDIWANCIVYAQKAAIRKPHEQNMKQTDPDFEPPFYSLFFGYGFLGNRDPSSKLGK
jgi:hypothetical protein